MVTAMQLVFFLYILVSITVCDDVFKMVNSSVQLDIQIKVEKFHDIAWKFNTKTFIVRFVYAMPPSTVLKSYKDRLDFNEETYSLTLKNVQKSDSGIYEAKANDETEEVVAMYQLHVLDPVEKPVLNAFHQQSNDFCNVTLTCEAQNLSVTSHCYNDNCDMMEKKTSGDMFPFLSLYVKNSFIICNHSNPVSWKNTTMEIKHVKELCPNEDTIPVSDKRVTVSLWTILIFISIFILIFIIIIIIIINSWLRKRKNTNSVNTVIEEAGAKNKGGEKAESVEMSENHSTCTTTVYYTVGMPAHACSNDESTVQCLICSQQLAYNNTSSMLRHFRAKHDSARSSVQDVANSQGNKKDKIDEALVNMIVQDSQPCTIVEDVGFRNFVSILDPTYMLPSRPTLKTMVEKRFTEEKERAKDL